MSDETSGEDAARDRESRPLSVLRRHRDVVLRVIAALAVTGLALLVWLAYGDSLTLDFLARQERTLAEYRRQRPVLVYGAALGLLVVATGLSIPAATALTLSYAWLFGFWRAVVLVSFGTTAGATLAFLLSRYLFHDLVQRWFGARLARFNDALRHNGVYYLFLLRLTPVVPFFVINLVMGLTPLRAWTFWWVSQVGMLPASCVWAWAGASFPSMQELAAVYDEHGVWAILSWQIVAALSLIGVFPLAVRAVARRWPSAAE